MDGYNVTFAQGHGGYSAGEVEARVGREAPDFVLETVDHAHVRLQDHRGKEHVVMVFGSIT